ncbi:MAG: hypothetical protein ACYCZV_13980 [Acidimicrobiales bacterium]
MPTGTRFRCSDLVFTTPAGTWIDPNNFVRATDVLIQKAGVPLTNTYTHTVTEQHKRAGQQLDQVFARGHANQHLDPLARHSPLARRVSGCLWSPAGPWGTIVRRRRSDRSTDRGAPFDTGRQGGCEGNGAHLKD